MPRYRAVYSGTPQYVCTCCSGQLYGDQVELPRFDPRPDEYLFEQVADHLEARIHAGELPWEKQPEGALPVGTKIPGERQLSEEYGIALGTARRAVQELRDRGLVRTLPARGTFVVARDQDNEGPAEPSPAGPDPDQTE